MVAVQAASVNGFRPRRLRQVLHQGCGAFKTHCIELIDEPGGSSGWLRCRVAEPWSQCSSASSEPMGTATRLIALGTLLSLSTACDLGIHAALAAGQPPIERQAASRDLEQRFVGVWALNDSANTLFNVRVFNGGRAVSTIGSAGVPMAGAKRLQAAQFRELGHWVPWGNGIRIDYNNGWTDWIYVSPTGLTLSSWGPGQPRSDRPINFGTAVKLSEPAAEAVGVYSFAPAQQELQPYTAALLSNGLAFNSIDDKAGGIWRMKGSTVVIDWISGWRTTMSLDPATKFQLRHWAPGDDRNAPSRGGVRMATVIQ